MCALSDQSLQGRPRPSQVQTLPGLWTHQPLPEGQLLQHPQRRVWGMPAGVRGWTPPPHPHRNTHTRAFYQSHWEALESDLRGDLLSAGLMANRMLSHSAVSVSVVVWGVKPVGMESGPDVECNVSHGDCVLNRYYRKTKLSGFQDMECIPCGDPPPPYEPHCKHLPPPHHGMFWQMLL